MQSKRLITPGDKMDYVKFGNTGMDISRICLGGFSFGDATKEYHAWALDYERVARSSSALWS